jgi:hypothetical protein
VPEAPPTDQKPLLACLECGAPLQDEHQEMCVECGAAVTCESRAPRLRRVLSPVALGGFATLMVASAAYGLISNFGGDTPAIADKVAAAPPATAAPPAPAPAPAAAPTPAAPSAPAPAAKPPAPAPAAEPADPAPEPAAKPKPDPTAQPASPTTSPPPSRAHSAPAPAAAPEPSPTGGGDQPYSAALYDPYGDGTDEHSAAAPKAVDGRVRTAWTTAEHPDGLGKPGVGLVLEAGGYQSYSAIGIQTAKPGSDVEIYTTDASDPPAGGPSAAGWRRVAVKRGVKKQQRIAMRGGTGEPTYVLVWITTLPAGKSQAGLSEIALLP